MNHIEKMSSQIITTIESVLHIRSMGEFMFGFVTTISFGIVAHYNTIFSDNHQMFLAIWVVVIVDWVFGVWRAIQTKTFETQKALKIVYYLSTYTVMLYTILEVEKGYPSAFWLSDAIVMPILLFQIVSIIKNVSILGFIPQGVLLEILKKIDNYKEQHIESPNPPLTPPKEGDEM